jgi:hypothetical protein
MTPEALNAYWASRFPECPPVGYLLKHLYRERCARFRNFDNGRRFPAGEADLGEVCARQNALLDHLFESEPDIVLITTIPSELETPPEGAPSYLNFDPRGAFFQSLGMHEFELEFETPSYWHLFMSVWEYETGVFDALLRVSAEDPAASGVVNTLILGPATRRLFYVYPGGADAVLESPIKRDQARNRFLEWSV